MKKMKTLQSAAVITLFMLCLPAGAIAGNSVDQSLRKAFSIIDNGAMMRELVEFEAKESGLGKEDFSLILAGIAKDSRDSNGIEKTYIGDRAMTFLRDYGTTNALQTLSDIIMNPGGDVRFLRHRQESAMRAFASIDGSGPRSIRLADQALASTNILDGRVSFFYELLDRFSTPENAQCVDAFLLSRTHMETNRPSALDRILCRRIGGYETSTHRMSALRFGYMNCDLRFCSYFSNAVANAAALVSGRSGMDVTNEWGGLYAEICSSPRRAAAHGQDEHPQKSGTAEDKANSLRERLGLAIVTNGRKAAVSKIMQDDMLLIQRTFHDKWIRPAWSPELKRIKLEVQIGRDGLVTNSRLNSSSGDSAVDQSVLDAASQVGSIRGLSEDFLATGRTVIINFDVMP